MEASEAAAFGSAPLQLVDGNAELAAARRGIAQSVAVPEPSPVRTYRNRRGHDPDIEFHERHMMIQSQLPKGESACAVHCTPAKKHTAHENIEWCAAWSVHRTEHLTQYRNARATDTVVQA
jgi:hypothetical protein